MSTRKKPASDKKPLFERGDVVKTIGIQGPDMLVSEKPELNDAGEYNVTCMYFNHNGDLRYEYSEQYFTEDLLQLVKPAAKVREEAEAATKEARGQY